MRDVVLWGPYSVSLILGNSHMAHSNFMGLTVALRTFQKIRTKNNQTKQLNESGAKEVGGV